RRVYLQARRPSSVLRTAFSGPHSQAPGFLNTAPLLAGGLTASSGQFQDLFCETQPSVCPFTGLAADTPELRVKEGSKIRNLLRFALSRMEGNPRGGAEEDEGRQRSHAPCQQMVVTASGKGVSKAISCAEIVKRRVKGLHQLTRLLHSTVVEVWEPLEPAAGLDSLNVSRKLPAVWILLSREPLDSSQPGYQAPGHYDGLWAPPAGREDSREVRSQRQGFSASF
uniref:Ribonuclease P/MRP 25 subunit-like n=1 Tax=Oryzias melastigma TaxID=30732 RepID=A0A3B3D2D2_ORYME